MQNYLPGPISIKALAEEDRPREKMQLKGRQMLSDAELLAIILRSGSADESALALAQRLLQSVSHSLYELGKQSVEELSKYKGIGPVKAITIAAALELGRRRQLSDIKEKPQVCNSEDAYKAIAPLIADLAHEEFWILKLNRANRITGRERVSAGGMSGTVVDSKMVFRAALEGRTASLILCHNHPSGNLKPSQADIDLTKKLTKAGLTLDMPVLDHLIIAETGYYSFADEGMMG